MSLSSSVSFRQGANVEFAGPAFVSTGDGKSGHDEVSYRTMSKQSCTKFCIMEKLGSLLMHFTPNIYNFQQISYYRLILNSD